MLGGHCTEGQHTAISRKVSSRRASSRFKNSLQMQPSQVSLTEAKLKCRILPFTGDRFSSASHLLFYLYYNIFRGSLCNPRVQWPSIVTVRRHREEQEEGGVFVWIIRQSEWNMEPDCCRNLNLSGALYCRCVLLTSSLTTLTLTVFSLTSSLTTMSSLAPNTSHFKGANIEDFACESFSSTWYGVMERYRFSKNL